MAPERETYSQAQLERYFQHIGFDPSGQERGSVAFLAALLRRHLARVPFENVSLHYSKTRLLSLDAQDLYEKIVSNSRGGYCMEVNAFFATVLRSLGYTFYSAGARVKDKGHDRFGGWFVFLPPSTHDFTVCRDTSVAGAREATF
jgi:arylamine N-acetyltransferase